jgi:hypothetical protein
MSDDAMPVDLEPGEMFTLLDCQTVRLQLPTLTVIGIGRAVAHSSGFRRRRGRRMLERLTVLRTQMLPTPQRN